MDVEEVLDKFEHWQTTVLDDREINLVCRRPVPNHAKREMLIRLKSFGALELHLNPLGSFESHKVRIPLNPLIPNKDNP